MAGIRHEAQPPRRKSPRGRRPDQQANRRLLDPKFF
jgi:hypothetical protein